MMIEEDGVRITAAADDTTPAAATDECRFVLKGGGGRGRGEMGAGPVETIAAPGL
jgi:hypothetical protein